MRARRYRLNPFFDPHHRTPSPDPATLRFHQSMENYRPTPLWPLSRMAESLGLASLTVKDEAPRFGLGSYKVLGAAWAASRLASRNNSALYFSAATAGNHGKALAWACRQLGKRAVIFVPRTIAPHRADEIRHLGADVIAVPADYDETVRVCAQQSAERGWQMVSDMGFGSYNEVPELVMEGYRTLFREADWQRQALRLPDPTLVIAQAGVGGLAGAAVRHFLDKERPVRPAIAVVEPIEADCHLESILSIRGTPTPSAGSLNSVMSGLNCGQVSTASWPDVRSGVRVFLSVEDSLSERAMISFYRPSAPDAPVTSGASGAAGLAGLLALLETAEFEPARRALQLGPSSHVLIVNTEGDTDRAHFSRVVSGG